MVLGVLVALTSALFASFRESSRKHVSRDFSSVQIGFMGQVYGVLLLFPFAVWRYTTAGLILTPHLLFAVLVAAAVVLSSTYLYIEAMRISDISMTEPLRKTTPIFVALLEPLVLGISFRPVLLVGALLGTAGAYILVSENSLLKPLENLSNKGALLSLLVALIFAIWAITLRFGATNTDPLLFMYMTYVAGLVGFGLWMRREPGIERSSYMRKDVFFLGTITAVSAVVGVFAYSLLSASEVTIIKQTSAIFGIIIGSRFFDEKDLMRKVVGALIIISGVSLVVL